MFRADERDSNISIGFKNEFSRNVWSSCLVLLPQRENGMISAPHAATPLYQPPEMDAIILATSPRRGSPPHMDGTSKSSSKPLQPGLLDMKEPEAPRLAAPLLSGCSATSFQQILLEAATRVIEELIFLSGFGLFLRPIPDSQIHLCPFLCNAEIAPSHVFLTQKSQVSGGAGASAARRDGRKAILINNCQFYCRLPQTRMSGSTGERHSG